MGAKGVLYFTYWDDPDGQHYGFGNSIITRRALPDSYNQSDCYPSLTCPSDYVKGERLPKTMQRPAVPDLG